MLIHQGLPPALSLWYPFIHLGGERHCESKVSFPRTQHNVPGQGSNTDCSDGRADERANHEASAPSKSKVKLPIVPFSVVAWAFFSAFLALPFWKQLYTSVKVAEGGNALFAQIKELYKVFSLRG